VVIVKIEKLILLWFFVQSLALKGQTPDTIPKLNKPKLMDFFKKGKSQGHFRYYFMATDNASGLTDYYANAIGGGLRHETMPFYGFQLGVSGFYIFNLGSSELQKPDPKTGQYSRYESGQFDIENLENKVNLNRLEELYLKYSYKSNSLTIGRQIIKTPFINP